MSNQTNPYALIQAAAAIDPGLAEALRRYTAQKLCPDPEIEAPTLTTEVPTLPNSAALPDELGAAACPWLDEYIQFSRTWSPRSYADYHEACGLWLLSTVAARRLRTDFGGPRFSPLYILLTGRSSLFAKTTAANIATAVLRAAGLDHHLAPDQATPQKFLSLLASRLPDGYDQLSVESKDLVRRRLGLCGARGWFHEEFGSQIHAMMQPSGAMAEFRGLLRRFDDCPETYESATIVRDVERVQRPYLALLGNLTPADLDGNYIRFAEKALRVALLLAGFAGAARVEPAHWARAQQISERWRAGLHALYESVNQGASAAREQEEKVMKIIQRHGPMTAAEVARYTYHLGVAEAKQILDNLATAGALEAYPSKRTTRYDFPGVPGGGFD